MKVGDRVRFITGMPYAVHDTPVVAIRGDYVYALTPRHTADCVVLRRTAYHRRTGGARVGRWALHPKHCDPKAGRGTTR
jgi:hypothetical protein